MKNMKGTMIYDITVFIGAIILIFVLILFSMTSGAQMISDIMRTSPIVVQDSFSSYISYLSTETGNATILLKVEQMPYKVYLTDNTINVKVSKQKVTENERSGSVEFKPTKPSPFIVSDGTSIKKLGRETIFSKTIDKGIAAKKDGNEMWIEMNK